jgi:two-component system, chemotaxis family, protein-glutamate methylesterase/glutaminase
LKQQINRVIVIGTSAGGLSALSELVMQFPKDLKAAVFVVLHLSRKAVGEVLVHHLQKHTSFVCKIPKNDEVIEEGTIYIAPPDYHMLLKEDKIVIAGGPAENRWRPSIDVLFRSAAAHYGEKVIGIILTGMLDDGTSGMSAIKRSGGLCVVQDPNEAEFSDMPLSVLNNIEVDYCCHLSEIGYILSDVTSDKQLTKAEIPEDVIAEAKIAERVSVGIDNVKELGENSIYSCPDCGGGLWEITEGNIHRYRCHIGHSFTEKELFFKQNEALEDTMWVAIRMMEERRNLLMSMADNERKRGLVKSSEAQVKRAENMELHIERLKELLFQTKKD